MIQSNKDMIGGAYKDSPQKAKRFRDPYEAISRTERSIENNGAAKAQSMLRAPGELNNVQSAGRAYGGLLFEP